jgi:hypothetical protein
MWDSGGCGRGMAQQQQCRRNRIIPRGGEVGYGTADEAIESKTTLLYGAAKNSDFAETSIKPEREV